MDLDCGSSYLKHHTNKIAQNSACTHAGVLAHTSKRKKLKNFCGFDHCQLPGLNIVLMLFKGPSYTCICNFL